MTWFMKNSVSRWLWKQISVKLLIQKKQHEKLLLIFDFYKKIVKFLYMYWNRFQLYNCKHVTAAYSFSFVICQQVPDLERFEYLEEKQLGSVTVSGNVMSWVRDGWPGMPELTGVPTPSLDPIRRPQGRDRWPLYRQHDSGLPFIHPSHWAIIEL